MRSTDPLTIRRLGWFTGMALLVVLAGCGRSIPTDPASAPPPPETGSNTLVVEAGIAGSDLPSGGFMTDFTATIRDGHGAVVSGATVVLNTPVGMVQLLEQPGAAGSYHCATGDYVPGTYSLTVASGFDRVSGVRVVAPDVHQILSPAAYDTVAAGSDLEIDWSRSAPTQEVVVETLDYNGAVGEDAGVTTIPSSGNPPRTDQRIRVIRSNLATMSGALPGSRLTASIRNSVEPVIAQ